MTESSIPCSSCHMRSNLLAAFARAAHDDPRSGRGIGHVSDLRDQRLTIGELRGWPVGLGRGTTSRAGDHARSLKHSRTSAVRCARVVRRTPTDRCERWRNPWPIDDLRMMRAAPARRRDRARSGPLLGEAHWCPCRWRSRPRGPRRARWDERDDVHRVAISEIRLRSRGAGEPRWRPWSVRSREPDATEPARESTWLRVRERVRRAQIVGRLPANASLLGRRASSRHPAARTPPGPASQSSQPGRDLDQAEPGGGGDRVDPGGAGERAPRRGSAASRGPARRGAGPAPRRRDQVGADVADDLEHLARRGSPGWRPRSGSARGRPADWALVTGPGTPIRCG